MSARENEGPYPNDCNFQQEAKFCPARKVSYKKVQARVIEYPYVDYGEGVERQIYRSMV